MSKQTAIANINNLILQERGEETSRKKHSSLDTIDALLEEERQREEERRQRNVASAGEAMDLVRSFGDYGLERRAAEAAYTPVLQQNDTTHKGSGRNLPQEKKRAENERNLPVTEYPKQILTPDVQAEFQRRASGQAPSAALTPYQQYMATYTAQRNNEAQRARENADSGWKYALDTLKGGAESFEANMQTPLAKLDNLDYWVSSKLGGTFGGMKADTQEAYDAAHAIDRDIERAVKDAKAGKGTGARRIIDAFGAAGNIFGSSMMGYGLTGMGAATNALTPVADNLSAATAGPGAGLGERAVAGASRLAGNILGDVAANPTNLFISAQSGIGTFDRAKSYGADDRTAAIAGLAAGMTEYLSNKMFSGTPLEDNPNEKGYIVELLEDITDGIGKTGAAGAKFKQYAERFFSNSVVNFIFDKSGEGMEEVITGVLDPWIARLTYNKDEDLATFDTLFEDYIGGVLMSLIVGAPQAAMDTARGTANLFLRGADESQDAGWTGNTFNAYTQRLMQNPDWVEKSQGDEKIVSQAMDSDSDSLQRYADIYNRVNDMYAMLAGKEPASVRETAFVTSMEAQNFFYIWATQGARAADAYYTQNVYAAARNRQAQAEAGYQQRQAEMRAQEAAMQPQSIPAPAAATPPLPQQSAQGNAATATPPAPPVPQNAAQRPTEGGELRLTPKLSGGYNSLTQRQDVAWGENDTTWTEGNRPVEFTYAVVPLDSLIISNDKYGGINKGYPTELQPRDRERATSQGQVQGMASGLVPQKLAASATAQNGAPLIRGDGVVIGGNGRSAAISLAYEKGMAGAYESFIRENGSRYGVDTRNLPKNPVLVRVVNGDEDWRNLAQELNVSSTAAYSATETAQTDATKIGDVLGLLVPNDDGDINTAANQDFIQAFVNRVVPANERGRMQTPAGLLSQDGLDRAINAIFAYAYGDTKLLTQFSEDLDPDMKNVINALAQSAPAVAALQSAIQEGSAYDIPARDTLLEALSIYRDARQEGKSVIEYLQQGDMLRQMNAEAAFIAGFIEQNKSSAKQLRFLFSALMQEVLDYGSPDQGSMFGGEDHDIQTALNGAVRRYGELSGKHLQRRSLEKPGGEQAAPGGGGGAQQTESHPADGGNRAGDEEDAGAGGAGLLGAVRGEVTPQEEDAHLTLPAEEAPAETNIPDESTVVNDDPADHTKAEQQVIEEYKNSVNEEVKEAFEKYLADPDAPFGRYKISDVTARQAEDAARLLGGDYSGYTNNINKNGITHILDEHGPNGTVNHSMADLNDAARIGYVLDNYDSVEIARYKKSGEPDFSKEFADKNNRPAPKLKFSKKVNGTYYVIEAVPESNYKKFWVVSAYIGDNNAEDITQAPDAPGPQNTPTAQLPSLPSAEDRVAQTGKTVNTPTLRLPTEEAPSEAQEAEKPLTLPQEVSRQPHEKLADAVRAELEEGNTITGARLQELAQEAYGGTRGSGAYDIKTAYDAMELAVNQYLMDADFVKQGNGDAETAVRTEMALQQFMGLLPTETVRTEEQQQFQQFSTPPNIAYLAAWAANIDAKDTVLEPSAGIGGLALWPKAWGATVYGNELSPRRAEILRSLGLDEVFTENAEQINNVLPDRIKPTVVLMNPPFSSAAGRLSTNSTANAKRHIEQALDRLEEGGRLVAILGQGMANDSKTFSPWWNDLRKEYSIRANLSIDGENFKKYGTTFGVQMVVIDKTGPQTGETITGSYNDLTDIPQALEGIRNERTQLEGRPGNGSERGDSVHAGPERGGHGPGRPAGSSQRPAGNAPRNGGSGASGSSGNGGRVQSDGAGEDGLRLGDGSDGNGVGGESTGNPLRLPEESQSERGPESESALPVRGLSEETEETEQTAPKSKPTAAAKRKAGNDDNVYAEYIPPKTPVRGAQKHPAKLVESAAMAAVDAPSATYKPNIPKELISSGALSDVQLTNIVYAGQAHSQMLPNRNIRKGYFIGDGTGVGKGRQLAGIILDNFRQGRTKALWISQRQNLYSDAKRDWKAMGMDPDEVYTTKKIKASVPIKADRGIVYTTYDTLASEAKSGKSRLDQIVEWLGEDFDGVICFDEAHTMGNLLGKQSKRGNSKPAERALAGAELQSRLPNARIVYASATMATDVSEMAFAERLGLWGPGTQFNNVRDFVSKISDGGMAAMELVARDMKAMGLYQARSISYDGVEYETLQHDLTPMQKDIYDTMSRAWQVTLQNMNKALEVTGANLNGKAKSKVKSAYYGALQRFYNQILTSMAVPSVIQDMKKELAKGRSIVIQIVNTNEAETERQLAKAKESGESLDDLDITPREALLSFFRNSFPVQVYEEYEDDNGNKHSRPVTDSKGNPVLDKKAVAMRDKMIAEIEGMSVPEGPLEMIYDAFGTENVAEVTGRGRRIVPGKDAYGNSVKIEEKRSEKSGEADAQAFQDGKKRILIFSDAGGTGKSYHADRTALNQQQRVHYLLQPGWSAPKAVQGFGRTHRSNEASAPIYKLVTTDVKGQKRFVSTIARRLDQLGALTKGQRQTGSGMFSARDNLESDLATDSLYNFYRALIRNQIEGLSPEDVLGKLGLTEKFTDRDNPNVWVLKDDVGRDMSLFLNRILALEYDEQNLVFDAFSRIFDDAYETALANGTLDMGMETVRADKIDILDDMAVREDPSSGVTTNYVQAKLSEKARILRTLDDLKGMRGDFIGLYRKKNGDVVGVFRTRDKTEADGSIVKQYILQTPLERKLSRYVEKTLKSECTRIPEKQWKSAWAEEVKKAPEYTETVKHMLTGSLLPIWNKLPQSGNVRVQRLIADDGRQYLGRIIDPSQIDGVLRSLGVNQGRTKQTFTADDVISRVFKGGDKAILEDQRMKLTRRRVGNEWRIEITGDNLGYFARQVPAIITENINFKNRYFIPNGDTQRSTLEEILKLNPVRDIETVGGDVEDSREVENFNGNTAPRHPENWKAERVGDKDKTPMSLTDIVNMIRHDFDIPVTTGNIRSRDARAQYRRQPQSVRSKIANSIPDIAHELGHHLDNIFGIRESLSAAAKAEVVDALPESFKAQYKDKSTWPGEGIAEFLRHYLQNSETAIMDYPVFSEEFFGRLDTKARATLDKLADEVNAYYALSEQTGNWPVHNREDKGRDYRSLGEKLQDMNTHFRTLFIDSMEPIKQFEKEAGGKAYLFATNAAYAGNRAYAAITGDLYDLRGNKLGVGLQKALEGIHLNNKKEYSDFGMYLICRHGPERLAEGMRVFSHDAWDNTAFMEQTVEELAEKYPNFEEAAERLEEYQHALIEAYGVASGLYSQETIDGWMERWEHYVPFLRWFGETEKRPKGQKQGFANQTRIHGKAVGSGLEIVNPVDNIMENTVRLITASIRNEVMQEITKAAAKTEGAGRWLEQVPMPLARKTWDGKGLKTKTLEEFDEYFKGKGKDLGEKGLDLIQEILDNAIDDLLVQYGRGKAHGDIVTVMKNGSPEYWKINDPDLLRSVTNMGPTRAGELLNYYGRITRFITGNITGMNIVWSVASNMPRDIGTMFTFSRTKNIAKLLAGIGDSYVNRIKGDKASDLYKEYMALGGNSTSAQTADKDMAKKARKALQKQRTDWLNPLEWVEFAGDMIESGPRYAYYKICRTQYGMTPEEAFYAAMEITVNFKKAGVLSREVNILVPFFNASIQGVDRAARWIAAEDLPADQRKAGRARRIGVYLGASLAIAALSMALNGRTKKKRDDLEKLSTYTKNNYFVVQMRNGKYLAIPKPRELAIPISLFERLMETYVADNPHAFDDFWEYVTDNTLPGVVSGIAQGDLNSAIGDLGLFGTLHYLTSNQDFLGRPIVSDALKKLEAKDQYDQTTSKLAKLIGEVFNVSPKQLDFLGNNLFGGFWQWQKALAPVSGKADLTLGVQSKWIKDPLFSTDITNRMYDERDRLERMKNSRPDDMDIAARYRTVSDISSFYGRYYRLAKNEEETPRSRVVREAMLDAILGVEQNANTEPARKFLLDVVDREGSTEYMPTVMDVTVKSDDGTVYALTAEEYFLHQTRYEALYYNYIRQAVDNQPKMTDEEKTSTVEAAKRIAGIVARGEIVEDHGGTYKAYTKVKDLLEDGVSEGNLINYLAAADNADADGSGKVSNAELLGAVSGLRLSGEESASLIGYSNESLGLKLRSVSDFGVDSGEYGLVLEALGDNTLSQAHVTEAIDQVYGPTTKANKEEKAALWQAMNKSWKASKNPYDPDVGERVQSGLTLPTD